MKVAALFVANPGCYFGLPDVDPWDVTRDARLYAGPWAVVAHPPCQLWGSFAFVNFKRWGGEHNRPGNDGGCFASALASVRRWGGVLEHPAFSRAWETHGLMRPERIGWLASEERGAPDRAGLWGGGYVCEVWQSAYGHLARKKTWLFYVGPTPPQLDWRYVPGTSQVGWFDRIKPTLSKKEASATPLAFRDMLLDLARRSATPHATRAVGS